MDTPMSGTSDKGIWATWYHLDDADRERFLGWLHATWLPALQKDGRYSWVAHYRDQEAITSETGVAGPLDKVDADEGVPVGKQFSASGRRQLAGAARTVKGSVRAQAPFSVAGRHERLIHDDPCRFPLADPPPNT